MHFTRCYIALLFYLVPNDLKYFRTLLFYSAGGGAGPGIRERDCSGAWWGRGLQCHSFGGQVCKSQARGATCLHLPSTTQESGRRRRAGGLQNRPLSGTRTGRVGRR